MSNAALNRAFAMTHHPKGGRIKLAEKSALVVLADTSRDGLRAWRSVASIAARGSMSVRTAQAALRGLEAGGTITPESATGKVTTWVLNLPAAAEAAQPEGVNGHHHPAAKPPAAAPPQISHPAESASTPAESAQTPADFAPKPYNQDSNPKTLPPNPPRGEGPEGFESFWKKYPNLSSRHDAERAWRRAVRQGAAPQDIIDGLEIALVDGLLDPREGGRFAGPASAWLRGRRWLDCDEHFRRINEQYAAVLAARAQPVTEH